MADGRTGGGVLAELRAGLHRRRGERRVGRRVARRLGGSVQSRAHRKDAIGRHRRDRPVPDRRPACRYLFGHLHAGGIQHGPARGCRARRLLHRGRQRRDEGRGRQRDDHGDGRNADRRYAERQAPVGHQQRSDRVDSLRARVRRADDADAQHGGGQRRGDGRSGGAGDGGLRQRRWPRERRAPQPGRPERRLGLQRGRRVVVHPRRRERAGGHDDDLGRPGRSRSGRAGPQHRAEDRRQHGQGRLFRLRRDARDDRQQLLSGAPRSRADDAGELPEGVGLQPGRRRPHHEGQAVVLRAGPGRRQPPDRPWHVRQRERRRSDQVDLRGGSVEAGSRRGVVPASLAAADGPAQLAQQVQSVPGTSRSRARVPPSRVRPTR